MVYLREWRFMRRVLITVVLVLGAAHLTLGLWMLANGDDLARTFEFLRDGGADAAQRIDVDAWGADVRATAGLLMGLGTATLLAGIAIVARWSWALAGWLLVISFVTAFHVLWCVMDWGRGDAHAASVLLTASIMSLCVFSWVRLSRADGRTALLGASLGEPAQ
jgi:hypothetical protein